MLVIKHIEPTDLALTLKIENCGTNKTAHKKDIIYLFKKYIDGGTYLCTSCSTEIMMAWNKYLYHYKKYCENLNSEIC